MPLKQTSQANVQRLIPFEVELVVFRRLKLLQYLHESNLSPGETLALLRRLETDTCRPEDSEALIRIVRAHTALSADGLEASLTLKRPASARRTSGQRQGAKRARRRPRREGGVGIDTTSGVRYIPWTNGPSERQPHLGVERWKRG